MSLRTRLALTALATAALLAAQALILGRPAPDTLPLPALGLELLAPARLGLACLLPLLWLFACGTLVDLPRPQRALSLLARAALLLVLIVALARPARVVLRRQVCTVFVVDVSDSVSADQLAYAQGLLQAAWAARGDQQLRLLTFAASPRAVPLDEASPRVGPLARHGGLSAGQQTDIQAALQVAYGLFPAGVVRRIALLTDGNQTRGSLRQESLEARRRGIRVHAFPLPARRQPEVLVRGLRLPQEVRTGAPFEVTAELYATHAGPASLTLYQDQFVNGLDGRRAVQLRPGRNEVRFRALVREAGVVAFRLEARGMTQDTWRGNNTASAVLPVQGRPRVLYVEGEPAHAGYLRGALEAERMDVEVRGPQGLPATAAALQRYDLVILSDVAALYVGPAQMAAVDTYVQELGGGFIMAGGPNAFGAGGYTGTRLERLLPVRFDTERRQDQPSLALALCIDRSGSMNGLKLELAKDAARATAELLSAEDIISVVAFDAAPQLLVRAQRAANRLRILDDISRLRSGGGTAIRPALQAAFAQLQGARAKIKHVILLSDGQSAYGGIPQLVDQMAQARITVSAVGVGGGADQTLLQMIAERGGGRFYHTNDPRSIPRIFTKETTQVARSAVVEEATRPRVVKSAAVLRGIDWGGAPPLRGYVATRARPRSETLLVAGHGEPLLALWRQGLGKAAAFTSDVKDRWASAWLAWPGYQKFWAQLAREVMRHRAQHAFALQARAADGRVEVTVDALDRQDRFINGLDATVTATDAQDPRRRVTAPLAQVAAGRYAASLQLPGYGAYLLRATHRADGQRAGESVAGFALPYPEELTHLRPHPAAVQAAARITGGALAPAPRQLFDPGQDAVRGQHELWPTGVYLALGLLLLDLLLRRVRLLGRRDEAR